MSASPTTHVHSRDLPPNNTNPMVAMVKSKLFTVYPQPPPSTDLSSRTAVITGAATGLGREAARQLLALNLTHLIIAARTVKRGESTAQELQSAFPKAKIEVWPLEMESYESVESFAKRCGKDLGRLDMAILNAGMGDIEMKFSSHGHEKTMQVNYYSTALLGVLLLPIMKAKKTTASPTPHLTMVCSDMSRMCAVPNLKEVPFLPTFDDEKWWNPNDRYGESKLAAQLFFIRLAEHVSPDDVIINMIEPGFTKGTGLLRNLTGLTGFSFRLTSALLAHPVSSGALTYVDAAAVQGRSSHGCNIDKGTIGP